MTQKQIYEAVCDLAYDENTSPEEYVLGLLKRQNDSALEGYDDLPEEIKNRLLRAEQAKQEARELRKRDSFRETMEKDISQFRQYFPDVEADSVPESVWNEAANGIPLAYSYAMYLKTKEQLDGDAERTNKYAEERAVPVGNDESEAPYTKEQVENMSASAVKSNYRKILDSIKGWKF